MARRKVLVKSSERRRGAGRRPRHLHRQDRHAHGQPARGLHGWPVPPVPASWPTAPAAPSALELAFMRPDVAPPTAASRAIRSTWRWPAGPRRGTGSPSRLTSLIVPDTVVPFDVDGDAARAASTSAVSGPSGDQGGVGSRCGRWSRRSTPRRRRRAARAITERRHRNRPTRSVPPPGRGRIRVIAVAPAIARPGAGRGRAPRGSLNQIWSCRASSGFEDPLRPRGAGRGGAAGPTAGIEVVMITGDHPDTAIAIARRPASSTAGTSRPIRRTTSASPGDELSDMRCERDLVDRMQPRNPRCSPARRRNRR